MVNVPINVHIRRNADGVERIYPFPEYGWDTDGSDYMWADGNYSCDCNRHIFFCNAGGEPEGAQSECGDTRYSVRIFDMAGNRLYADDDWHD